MWTPDRDAELRRLGVETYISRHPGADVHEVLDRYLLLLDPEGRAALLREKNRNIEAGKWTPPRRKTGPKPAHPCPQKPRTVPAAIRTDSPQWPEDTVERLRTMRARGLTAAEIAVILGKTEPAVREKPFRGIWPTYWDWTWKIITALPLTKLQKRQLPMVLSIRVPLIWIW